MAGATNRPDRHNVTAVQWESGSFSDVQPSRHEAGSHLYVILTLGVNGFKLLRPLMTACRGIFLHV